MSRYQDLLDPDLSDEDSSDQDLSDQDLSDQDSSDSEVPRCVLDILLSESESSEDSEQNLNFVYPHVTSKEVDKAPSVYKRKLPSVSSPRETDVQHKKRKIDEGDENRPNSDNCDKVKHVRESNCSKQEAVNCDEIEVSAGGSNTGMQTPKRKSETSSEEKEKDDIQGRRERTMLFLKTFVQISTKYSQFLHQKIHTTSTGDLEIGSEGKELEITKRLKFFTGKLRPYQLEGVTWLTILYKNIVNGILADEMGLGKTIQIIAVIAHLYEKKVNGPFLVVAPMSTLANWESEFKRFAPKLPVIRLQGTKNERAKQKRQIQKTYVLDGHIVQPVVIVSYQIPLMEENFLQKFYWRYIVVDEGHRIKNPDSQLFQVLKALKGIHRTLLTGTPLQNDIKELWALFNFLMPRLFNDAISFSSLLELDDMNDTDKLFENENKTRVIETIHKVLAPFMLRREKKFVLPDMVPKKEVIIYCPLTKVQKYQYMATLRQDHNQMMMGTVEQELAIGTKRKCTLTNYIPKCNIDAADRLKKNLIHNNVPLDLPDVPFNVSVTWNNAWIMLKKAVNHPYLLWTPVDPKEENRRLFVTEDLIQQSGKLMVLDPLLHKLKARGHKVLIFSTLVMFMDMVEEMLIMRNHSYRRFDGTTNFDVRNQCINDFSNDDEIFVFLLSTRAGGLGLNLTAADTVIFLDKDWNPMVDLQAQDRCHRIGQTKPVVIYSLITKGTIDELIMTRGEMKRRLERIVLQQGKFKAIKKNFSANDVKELEKLLKEEEKPIEIHTNGSLVYTNEEWEEILDREDLYGQMMLM